MGTSRRNDFRRTNSNFKSIIMAEKPTMIPLEKATIRHLRTCAKHAGMDELRDRYGPDFVYGDDLSPGTTKKVRNYLAKFYTHVDISNPNFVKPVKLSGE